MSEPKKPTYPVNLCLDTMPVLVVGGGKVALRKVRRLLEAGARVTLVAPEVEPELAELAGGWQIEWRQRPYQSGEASEYRLVFSATGNRRIDWQVSYDAATVGTFVNVADEPSLSTFFLPAVVRRGSLGVAVATDGAAPFAARRLRQGLDRQFGEGFAAWIEGAGAFRNAVRAAVSDLRVREELFDRFCRETLPGADDTAQTTEPIDLPEAAWREWIAAVAPDGSEDRAEE